MFREQLDVNSELQKENDQFVSLILTYMNFNFNYFTIRLRTTTDIPQSFQKLGLRYCVERKVLKCVKIIDQRC